MTVIVLLRMKASWWFTLSYFISNSFLYTSRRTWNETLVIQNARNVICFIIANTILWSLLTYWYNTRCPVSLLNAVILSFILNHYIHDLWCKYMYHRRSIIFSQIETDVVGVRCWTVPRHWWWYGCFEWKHYDNLLRPTSLVITYCIPVGGREMSYYWYRML